MLKIEREKGVDEGVVNKNRKARMLVESANHKMSQLNEAEMLLRDAHAQLPENPQISHNLALTLVYQGRSLESLPYHRIAFHHNKSNRLILSSYIDALVFNNEYEEAKDAIDQWAEFNQKDQELIEYEKKINYIIRSNQPKAMIHWPQHINELECPEKTFPRYLFNMDIPEDFILSEQSKIITLGSCFAENIARILSKKGFTANNITLGEVINSTYANLFYLRRVVGADLCKVGEVIAERLGRDPIEDQALFTEADISIITLGVAPCFFEMNTDNFVMFREREFTFHQLGEKYKWRNTSVAENVDNLKEIIAIIKKLNPKIRIVLTVSPIPLVCTFDYDSAIVADCVSKATLRAAVDETIRDIPGSVLYWPSFEAFRWIGAYSQGVYGADDGCSCHASEHILEIIFDLFINRIFCRQ